VRTALRWVFRGAKKHDFRAGERGWRDENENELDIMKHERCRNDREYGFVARMCGMKGIFEREKEYGERVRWGCDWESEGEI
jgi:hypothetical protein